MRGSYVTAVRPGGKRGGSAFVAAAPKLGYCIAAMLAFRIRHMTEILLAKAEPGANLEGYSATSGRNVALWGATTI
ncbi:hypothetical protein ACNHKD_17455 [Methylocystis sp. JAN1]|uniref:hypothetical protein n=1 Tax=Methylocystis sp. JAN1 TaxID=3397211 RepID=UPI003FA2AC4D